MVLAKEGSLFHRKDDKWIIYIPKELAVDSQFPFGKLRRGEKQKIMIHVSTTQGILIVSCIE